MLIGYARVSPSSGLAMIRSARVAVVNAESVTDRPLTCSQEWYHILC